MKAFEIFSKKNKNGRRKFKVILYKIFPDSCVDEKNGVGTEYNKNGITWIRQYCEAALPSIAGMSLRCQFVDEDRTEIWGHGETDIIDGQPVFEDAVQIGTFTKGYIEDVETNEGVITACIGEGEIDAQCYHNFVEKLDSDIANGIYPSGSVEIMHTEQNSEIVYKYGYKEKGRIPTEFIHSGYALLGIAPADDNAKLLELNNKNKEETNKMTVEEIKALIEQGINEVCNANVEIDKCKKECEEKVAAAVSEKQEAIASADKIQKALDEVKAELEAKENECSQLYDEKRAIEKELAKARAAERIAALDTALNSFSEEEKKCVDDSVCSFKEKCEALDESVINEETATSEINSIVSKIWENIGKTSKAEAERVLAEQNSIVSNTDIFGEIATPDSDGEAIDIFE